MLKVIKLSSAPIWAPFHWVLALTIVFMMAMQPVVFAKGAIAASASNSVVDHHSPDLFLDHHGASELLDAQDEASRPAHHHGDDSASQKSCEVHCAPAQAVPVTCPEIAPVFARCFHPEVERLLALGEYAALIRPPKT